jgi:hypothetical protein
MSKMFTYIVIISFITLGIYYTVPNADMAEITLLNYLRSPESYTESYFYKSLAEIGIKGAISAGVALLIAGFFSLRPELAIMASFVTYIYATFFSALLEAYSLFYASGIPLVQALGVMIIGVFLFSGVFVVIDWWRAKD